jgi:hypothetical protein
MKRFKRMQDILFLAVLPIIALGLANVFWILKVANTTLTEFNLESMYMMINLVLINFYIILALSLLIYFYTQNENSRKSRVEKIILQVQNRKEKANVKEKANAKEIKKSL